MSVVRPQPAANALLRSAEKRRGGSGRPVTSHDTDDKDHGYARCVVPGPVSLLAGGGPLPRYRCSDVLGMRVFAVI